MEKACHGKGNPARRFHLRAALPDRWAKALPNLSVEQGAAVFTELISGFKNPEFERSGFKVDVEQLRRTNMYDVLRGEAEIVVLGKVANTQPKRKQFSPITVAVTLSIDGSDQARHFTIEERVASRIGRKTTRQDRAKVFSAANEASWKNEIEGLGFSEMLALLNAALFMLRGLDLLLT